MTSKGVVLVTGANGFIAARTVEAFLEAGYSVRGTVRSKASGEPLLKAFSDIPTAGKLEIVEVPDITVAGAFDEAVKGVTAVAHLAQPVSFAFSDPDYVIGTAVKGTRSVLESAAKEAGIKNFVLMSSVAAIRDTRQEPRVYTEADWNDYDARTIAEKSDNVSGAMIYCASKAEGERELWRFQKERNPSFTMTAVNPVFVAGPPLPLPASPDKINETTRFIWAVLSGQEIPQAMRAEFVDVRDVARLVVFGVEHADEARDQRYLAASGFIAPQAAADVLRRAYPERRATIQEGTPGSGYQADYSSPPGAPVTDASKAVAATGQPWISVETMILDTAKAFEAYL